MDDPRARGTAGLALAAGIAAAGSAACLATYFAVGGPFGTLNDVGTGAAGVLSAALAWRLRRQVTGRAGPAALAAAVAGGALTVVGSALVISQTTGFMLAGLVSSVGYAGIGAWLVVASRSDAAADWTPGRRALGLAAGGLMAFGIVVAPGIVLRLDDLATAPAWVWLGNVGWLGIFVVYPAWAIWTGIAGLRDAGPTAVVAADPGARPAGLG